MNKTALATGAAGGGMSNMKMAACGVNCNVCGQYKVTAQRDLKAAEGLVDWYRSQGWIEEDEGAEAVMAKAPLCKGCWNAADDCFFKCGCGSIDFRVCCNERKINHCGECGEFPCKHYKKFAEEAYHHNIAKEYLMALKTGQKVALVTGAAGGIGLLTARRLIAEGYTVWCVDRSPLVEEVNNSIASGVVPVQLDLNDSDGIEALAQRIVSETGGVDVIVNNAGYGQYGPIETVPMEAGRRQMEVNFFAPVRLVQLLAPSMRARGGGRIVNISSVAGKVYSPLSGWYCASKFALEGITDCLRIELKPFNIGVSLVEPSPIRTAWSEGAKHSLLEASQGTAYEAFAQKAYRLLAGATGGGAASGPEAVVKCIMRAIHAKNPRPRYLAGKIARLSVVSKAMLGDRLFDMAMNSQLK